MHAMTARVVPFLVTALLLGAAAQAAGAPWMGERLLLPPLAPGDRFGATLAISDNLIAVGAYLADINGKRDAGAVYFYKKVGETWTPDLDMTKEGDAGDQLGFDLAIDSDGKTLLAGAPFARRTGGAGGVRCGAVRHFAIFEEEISEGLRRIRIDELERIEPPARDCEAGAEFGSAVAVDKDIIAVGARGAGRRRGRIYASFNGGDDPPAIADGGEGDELGTSLATNGVWLVAGAPFADAQGLADSGTAYVFAAGGSERRVQPRNPQAGAAFGYALAVQRDAGGGDGFAVGAPLEDDSGSDSGAVHTFARSSTSEWDEMPVAHGERARDQLGVSVSWGEYGLFAGARRAGGKGAVYPIDEGVLGEAIPPPSDDPPPGAEFGFGVAVAPRKALLVVGASLVANASGAAYVYEQEEPTQVVTVSLAEESACVVEGEGRVALKVNLETTDRKPLATAVEVDLKFCPPGTVCTAATTDFRPLGTDFHQLGKNPQIIRTGTAIGMYTIAWIEIQPDSALEGPEVLTVGLSPKATPDQTLLFEIKINDSRLVLPAGPLRTREQGPPVSIPVGLACPPTADVRVTLETTDATEGTLSSRARVFEALDPNLGRTVDLRPVDDPLCDGPQTYAVIVQTTSDDSNYNLSQSIPAENEDDELACLSVAKSVCTYPDNTVVYTIELSNVGPEVVTAHLEDPLPSELSVVTANADSGVATVDYLENSVVWNGLAPAPGDRVKITVVAALDPVAAGTEVANQATLTWHKATDSSMPTAMSDDPATEQLGDATVFRALEVGCPP